MNSHNLLPFLLLPIECFIKIVSFIRFRSIIHRMDDRLEPELIDLTMSSRSSSMESIIDITQSDDEMPTLSSSHPTTRLLATTKEQARHLFHNKRVLFAGDASIRTLYRDMARLLEDGNQMPDADVNIPMGDYPMMPSEIHSRRGGQVGDLHHFEVRMYRSPPPSATTLYYVYINGLRSAGMRELTTSLQHESFNISFDLFIFSSFESDMHQSQIATPSFTFTEHITCYIVKLHKTLRRLKRAAHHHSPTCLLVWMSPCSKEWSSTMSDVPLPLQLIYSAVNEMATYHGFRLFDRNELYNAYHPPFNVPMTGRLTAMGLRLVTTMIYEDTEAAWQNPVPPLHHGVTSQ